MNISLQDVRNLGYSKIYKANIRNFITLEQFMSYSSQKIAPYSLLRKLELVNKDVLKQKYMGMYKFLTMCDPMVFMQDGVVEPAKQRKFRNEWDKMWKAIYSSTKIIDPDEKLKNLGLQIIFDNVPSIIYEFYNYLLLWTVLTQSESILESLNIDIITLLDMLVTKDISEIISIISKKVGNFNEE